MKISKFMKFCAMSLAIVMAMPYAAGAASFSDVPNSHWAYAYIDRVSNAGIMLGDINGRFNPDNPMDKFEASKILAMMAGFKYTGRTASEQSYYDASYAKWQGFIKQYHKFSKWKSAMDIEIAYLLELGILVTADLDQFVVIVSNEERLRALSRQEAAVFLVKVMGKASEATSRTYAANFSDNANINAGARPYVYYLRDVGVISGDGGNFNPDSAASRVQMSVMVTKVLDIMNPPAATPTPTPVPTPGTVVPSATYTTVTGVISKIYSSFRGVQVTPFDTTVGVKIYPVSTNAIIKLDGYTKAFENLTEGMTITGVLNGTDLMSVTAVSSTVPAVPTPTPAPASTAVPAVTPAERTTLEGTVSSINFGANGNYVGIEVRMLNPRGVVYTETRTFLIPSDCVITRGELATTHTNIAKGDIITAEVAEGRAYKIKLEEKNRSFTATLVEKKYITETNIPVIVLKDNKDKLHEFTITNSSYLYRRGVGVVSWNELRIGDSIDIKTEYDKVTEIYAYGTRSTDNVWVNDIFISNTEQSRITVTTSANKTAVYPLITGTVDPYTLRVGSRIRINLDSNEIESFSVIQDATPTYMTGFISGVSGSKITVRDSLSAATSSREFTFDSSTVVTDSITGKQVTSAVFAANMKVYIVTTSSSVNYAKTITILGY